MTEHRFNNSASQEERRRVLRESTLFGRAQADNEEGGRYAKLNRPVVVGSSPSPYPKQPSGSWTADPVPAEPPLNEEGSPDAT